MKAAQNAFMTPPGHVVQDVLGNQGQDVSGRINDAVGRFMTHSISREISPPKDFASEILARTSHFILKAA
ncbi:hypothetical protein J6590_016751 [Homalodisca vitripennis]|nr:hypothetical protein J6590_016751 [Homalodisca vitripennis]